MNGETPFRQRIIPAKDAPRPSLAASAVPSVFDAGKKAKRAAAKEKGRFDPSQAVIKRKAPIPRRSHGGDKGVSVYDAVIDALGIGDCVEVAEKAHRYGLAGRMRKRGILFAVRTLPNGKFGIWRKS